MDVTGRWVGHYFQKDRPYPITADLVQEGERLTGRMRDGQPDREDTLFEMAVELGLPPGADEQIEVRLRQEVPELAAGPVRYISHLPGDSVLEGHCRGDQVAFVKTYQGTSVHGFRVGDRVVGHESPGHAVRYEGRVSADGRDLEGRWWIEANPDKGTGRVEGAFLLHRVEGDQAAAESRAEAGSAEPPAAARPKWWKFWSQPAPASGEGSR